MIDNATHLWFSFNFIITTNVLFSCLCTHAYLDVLNIRICFHINQICWCFPGNLVCIIGQTIRGFVYFLFGFIFVIIILGTWKEGNDKGENRRVKWEGGGEGRVACWGTFCALGGGVSYLTSSKWRSLANNGIRSIISNDRLEILWIFMEYV